VVSPGGLWTFRQRMSNTGGLEEEVLVSEFYHGTSTQTKEAVKEKAN